MTTTHVHLDARRCLEVILLRGPARTIRELADSLIGTKGVETGRLVLASAAPVPARNGEGPASHHHHDTTMATVIPITTTPLETPGRSPSAARFQQPERNGQRVVERRVDARGFQRGGDAAGRVELGGLDQAGQPAQFGALGIDPDGRRVGRGADEAEHLGAAALRAPSP